MLTADDRASTDRIVEQWAAKNADMRSFIQRHGTVKPGPEYRRQMIGGALSALAVVITLFIGANALTKHGERQEQRAASAACATSTGILTNEQESAGC